MTRRTDPPALRPSPLLALACRGGALCLATAFAVTAATGTAQAETSPEAETATVDLPRPDITDVAHRGASAYAPENTLAAVELAAELHASTAEIDVQRSADGELVLMHDVSLVRTTDAEEVFPDRDSYDVGDFTLKELEQLDAGSWFGEEFAGEPLPTLREILDLMKDLDLPLLLEIKSSHLYPGIEQDAAEELRADRYWLRPYPPGEPHRLVVQSFEWDTMEKSKRLLPWIPHGLLGRVQESDIEDYARWADQINPNHTTIDADYVHAVQDAGMEIYVYTVNDPGAMAAQLGFGVDGIISDYPDVLREVIAGHQA